MQALPECLPQATPFIPQVLSSVPDTITVLKKHEKKVKLPSSYCPKVMSQAGGDTRNKTWCNPRTCFCCECRAVC